MASDPLNCPYVSSTGAPTSSPTGPSGPNAGGPATENCSDKPNISFDFTGPTGPYVVPDQCIGTLDYSTSECADSESAYVANLMAEALNAAAGPINVFPLLGVHNQGSTIDQPGDGFPLSSGTPGGYDVADAFNVNDEAWRSVQTGADVTSTPAYIGYDFGTKKAWQAIGPAQERYYPSEPVRRQISTLKIKQGGLPENRATQVRVEASDDGVSWKRIDVVNLPSTDQLVAVGVRSTAKYNKWRIVPTLFGGVVANTQWEIVEVHFLEMTQVSLDNIQDFVLLENRDRAYCRTSTMLKCTYDLLDVQTELAKFGINLPQTYIFTTSFAQMVKALGRPVVVGDIVDVPGEVQYDPQLRPVRRWLEVTDTGWSTEGYTQNWKPNLFRFYAQPILPSVEHRDILGVPGQVNEAQSDEDVLANGFLLNQQAYEAASAITQEAADAVPQDGQDPQNIQSGKSFIHGRGSYDGRDLYVQDAIPPNGEPFTVGDALPDTSSISDGHWHRQTYTTTPASIRPPDRLLKWDAAKGRWRVIERGLRAAPESNKKTMASIMKNSTSVPPDSEL